MTDLIERDEALRLIAEEQAKAKYGMEDCALYRASKIVRELPAAKSWIPCSERLPDNGVAVLVYTGENNFKVWLAEYSKYMEVWTLAGNYVPIKKNAVSHWMPLPEPPESGAQDEAQP